MLYSMTGYGQGIANEKGISVFVEAKSVNGRYLEPSIRLPSILAGSESLFIQLVHKYISRGRVNLFVQVTNAGNLPIWKICLDENLLDGYAALIEQIESRLAIERTVVSIDRFLTLNELFSKTPDPIAQQHIQQVALTAANSALKSLLASRKQEGKELQKDIQKRIVSASAIFRKIQILHDNSAPNRFKRLREYVEQIASNIEIDPLRLAQEVAFIATKADCTEEIVRLDAHLKRLENSIKSKKPVGSLLNFILQECHRETNTIGTKTDIPEISSIVIDLKEEFERIKEQVQNIE